MVILPPETNTGRVCHIVLDHLDQVFPGIPELLRIQVPFPVLEEHGPLRVCQGAQEGQVNVARLAGGKGESIVIGPLVLFGPFPAFDGSFPDFRPGFRELIHAGGLEPRGSVVEHVPLDDIMAAIIIAVPFQSFHKAGGVQGPDLWRPEFVDGVDPPSSRNLGVFYFRPHESEMDIRILGGQHGKQFRKGIGGTHFEGPHLNTGFLLEQLHADGGGNIVFQGPDIEENQFLDALGGFLPAFGQDILIRQQPLGHGFGFIPVDLFIGLFFRKGTSSGQQKDKKQTNEDFVR